MTTWILSIDASTPVCVLALGDADLGPTAALFEDVLQDAGGRPSEGLEHRIATLLNRAGIRSAQLGGVACGRGPGTFTGVRVALSTAKGLALGLAVPVFPVSTLATVAASVDGAGTVLGVLDARRDEVYAGLFRVGPDEVTALDDERCQPWAEVVGQLPRARGWVTGPGLLAHSVPDPWQRLPAVGPSPRGLWRATLSVVANSGGVDPGELRAVYLRKSYAQLGVNVPKRTPFVSPFAQIDDVGQSSDESTDTP